MDRCVWNQQVKYDRANVTCGQADTQPAVSITRQPYRNYHMNKQDGVRQRTEKARHADYV